VINITTQDEWTRGIILWDYCYTWTTQQERKFEEFEMLLTEGFEVLTPVVMRGTIFWDITPCSPLKVNRRFGGTHRILPEGRRLHGVVCQKII
jgi:hypothetical protein